MPSSSEGVKRLSLLVGALCAFPFVWSRLILIWADPSPQPSLIFFFLASVSFCAGWVGTRAVAWVVQWVAGGFRKDKEPRP